MYDRHSISSCCICFTITDFFLFSYYIALIQDFKRFFPPRSVKKIPRVSMFQHKNSECKKKSIKH